MSKVERNLYMCDMCGKRFIRQPRTIYKRAYQRQMQNFCSYTCRSKADTLMAQKQYVPFHLRIATAAEETKE